MKPNLTSVAALVLAVQLGITGSVRATEHSDYAFGADLSFLKQVEDRGTKFKDGGVEKPGLQIFSDHGYNWIRLRACVEPVGRGLPNNLEYTIAMAKEAKKNGFKFLLDFHYSNGWADPTNEPTPEKWRELSPEALVDAVFDYTRDTIVGLRDAGVLPDMVQIGNGIGNGMMWPVGKLPEHWDNLAALVYAGINGVDAGRGNFRRPKNHASCRSWRRPVPYQGLLRQDQFLWDPFRRGRFILLSLVAWDVGRPPQQPNVHSERIPQGGHDRRNGLLLETESVFPEQPASIPGNARRPAAMAGSRE
jgi:hypothetical protein